MAEVSIIIPVWNRSHLTKRILEQLREHVFHLNPEIVIVDNGSTDDTPELLRQWEKSSGMNIKVKTNVENVGFGPGHNDGINISTGRIFAFVSNDVLIKGDFVTPLVDITQSRSLVSGRIVDFNSGWNVFNGKQINYPEGWFIGCARDLWEELGGWDERYTPCDYEDMDLGMQCIISGTKMIGGILPVEHGGFGSSASQLEDRLSITHANRQKFYDKWKWWFTGESDD
jgi:GT2 family glycosyltransferase